MNKKHVKFAIIGVLVAYVGLIGVGSGFMNSWQPSGMPSFWSHAWSDGHGHFHILNMFRPAQALAQQPAGGPTGGAPQAPTAGKITGQATVPAGNYTLRVPAIGYNPAIYTNCFVSILSPLPPVAGDLPGCAVTSTATVTGSPAATSTVGAINIQIAGTPSPSPVIMWTVTQ